MILAADTTGHPTSKATEHRSCLQISGLWAIGLLLTVLYGSLIPFSIDLSSLEPANGFGLLNIHWHATTIEDALTNVLIYVPVGIALILTQSGDRKRVGVLVAFAVVVGATVSMLAEALQTGIAIRVASWTDVLLNVIGTAVGAGAGVMMRRPAADALLWLRTRLSERPLSTLAGALAIGLFAYHLAPFDFVTDSAGLHGAFGRARWNLLIPQPTSGEEDAVGLLMGKATGAAWFAALGYFLAFAWREAGRAAVGALGTAVKHGLVLVVVIEMMQLFVQSHVFDVVDIVLRSLAVILGAWAAIFVVDVPTGSRWRERPGFAMPTLILAALALCQVLSLVGSSLVTSGYLTDGVDLGRVQWLPFEGLWQGPMLMAATRIGSTTLQYGALVLTLALCLRRVGLAHTWFLAGFAVTLLALTSEGIQVVNVARVPDLTVPVLALVSAALVARTYPLLRTAPVTIR